VPTRAAAPARAGTDLGLLAALASAAFFASSGPAAKSLLATGWTPGSVVAVRVGLAGLVLLPFGLYAARSRLAVLRRTRWWLLAYGVFAVAGCQVAYFSAVQRMPIAVALLIEYLGVVLVVLWMWLVHGHRPTRATLVGMVLAVAGLVLVLDLVGAGDLRLDPVGVLWGLLAAVGLAVYFVVAGHVDHDLPAVTLASIGMLVGAVILGGVLALGVLPAGVATEPVVLGGRQWPWWVPVLEVSLVAAAAAYLLGAVGARRLGSTVASFVGLTEVVFAVLLAWLLLGELPGPLQLLGGLLILAGVAVVKAGERSGAEAG